MLLNIQNLNKSIGLKYLFLDLTFQINEGEIVALIGRNGLGKTTLFNIINGQDKDFKGTIDHKKDIRIIKTEQEHFLDSEISSLEYILNSVPLYNELKNKLKVSSMNIEKNINEYSEYLNQYTELEFYDLEECIIQQLENFGINIDQALSSFTNLSGGEKRFVELVRVMFSNADLALIDEPTNHMDYIGKQKFIDWLKNKKKVPSLSQNLTILLITHDRDVLNNVDRILELKENKIFSFKGNYESYLVQNSMIAVTSLNKFGIDNDNIKKLHRKVIIAKNRKIEAKTKKGKMQARKVEDRFERELEDIKSTLKKPSLWIDQESKEELSTKIIDQYENFKEKNIKINNVNLNEYNKVLLKGIDLSIGYNSPLFKDINFELFYENRLFIKGRNGAGKTTLVRYIISQISQNPNLSNSQLFKGEIKPSNSIRLGIYEQEVKNEWLDLCLKEAIYKIYEGYDDIHINEQGIMNLLGQYLFNPSIDSITKIKHLSGGQKARLQIIKMMSNNPNLLILDEPTNHLDLPSVEELEIMLQNYKGAIIYISHDTYFIDKIKGEILEIK